MHILTYLYMENYNKIQVMCPLISLYRQFMHKSKKLDRSKPEQIRGELGSAQLQNTQTLFLPPRVTETWMRWTSLGHRLPTHLSLRKHPQLTGTSNASWVSSSIWILMDISFPEGVGGGFCPCSKVLIPEFSWAPSRDPGVGLCSISPMMKADYMISAGSSEKEIYVRRGDSFKPPK